MIKFTVEAVKYARNWVELELEEVFPTGSNFHRIGSTKLRCVKEDPLYPTIVEKATIGATMTLDFDAPPEEPQA